MHNALHPLLRVVLQLLLILGIGALLYFGRSFLVTFSVATLLAMLFDPFQNWLERRGWSRGWSTAACTLILSLAFAGLFFLLEQQVLNFAEDWPRIRTQVIQRLEELQREIFAGPILNLPPTAGVSAEQMLRGSLNNEAINRAVVDALSMLGSLLLMLVYFVLLLLEKDRLRAFIVRRFAADRQAEAGVTIDQAVTVAASYMVGRLISVLFLAIIYCSGFAIIGLHNGIFIGALGATLEMIPFIGNLIAGAIAVSMAVISGEGTPQILAVAGIVALGQFLETYILEPLVVGRKVDLNPLTTIVVIVMFTILWGPIGAIVAIPVAGVARIAFSHIPMLRDFAFLLGEDPLPPNESYDTRS